MGNIKSGLSFYRTDTDRYQNIKIKRLKRAFGCNGLAVFDFILNEIYRVQGCFLAWDEYTAFDVAEYFGLKETLVNEIVKYCASVGLFNKELLCRGILTSCSIQEQYLFVCKQTRRNKIDIPAEILLLSEETAKTTEETAKTTEETAKTTEETAKTTESLRKFDDREYNTIEYNTIEYNNNNLPQNARAREGGGRIKNIYEELKKHAQIPEDVWDAVAITGSFQNHLTNHYLKWLTEEEYRRAHPLNELNERLRKQCGNVDFNFYYQLGWVKDNLLTEQYLEIYRIVVAKPDAIKDLAKCVKEVKKGGIRQPGLFILKKLRTL